MANDVSLPNMQEPVFPGGKPPTHAYRKFFERLSRVAAGDTGLQAQIAELAAQVAALEASGGDLATLVQGEGIQISGQITDPHIRISLNAYLRDLQDVSDAAPADRDRLTWNATTELWEPAVILNPDLAAADTDGLAEGATNKYFHDAPSDGTTYGRKDGAWAAAGSSGSRGITVTGGSIGGSVLPAAHVIGGLSASDYTLTGNWYLWCSPAGSIELDVRAAAFGSIPPSSINSICGGNEPAVTGAISASGNFTGWSTSIARGDALSVVVNSVTDVTWFVLLLEAV